MAFTTTGTLTQEFVSALAMEMIPKPDDAFQFFASGLVYEPFPKGSVQGSNTLLVNQPVILGGTMTEASRRLTEGTAITTTPQAISETQFSLTVREYGGPHDGSSAVTPIGITEFLKNRVKRNLLVDLGEKLRRDYIAWRDAVIAALALGTTGYVSADGTAEGSITSAKAASYAWLVNVRKALVAKKLPTFPNGRYRGWLDPKDVAELLNDSTIKSMKLDRDDAPTITGYLGTIAGIDLFEATVLPTKAVGSGGAVTGYQSIFHGALGAVGHYEGMSAEPRTSTATDFGRQEMVAWVSHEAWGALDVNNMVVRGLTT